MIRTLGSCPIRPNEPSLIDTFTLAQRSGKSSPPRCCLATSPRAASTPPSDIDHMEGLLFALRKTAQQLRGRLRYAPVAVVRRLIFCPVSSASPRPLSAREPT